MIIGDGYKKLSLFVISERKKPGFADYVAGIWRKSVKVPIRKGFIYAEGHVIAIGS